ncbi:MAG: PAS domain-containing protein [Gemmatimonadaceae bacterium]|nr:PAS domain-containing protein [Gemmatimonadaceae bacterium]
MTTPTPEPPVRTSGERRTERRERLIRRAAAFVIAIALALLATALTRALPGFTARAVFFFHFAAIMVASWYGGRRAGLLCVLASALLVPYYILAPIHSFLVFAPADVARLLGFVILGSVIAILSGGLRDAMRRTLIQGEELQDQAMELEQQVEESQTMAAQLEESNEQLLRGEAALRRSERRYRALAEATSEMVWTTDANGMVEDMPLWRALTGQSTEEVRGHGWLEALHPDDRPRTAAIWADAVTARRPYESEYRLRLKDGSYRWYRARGVPVLDEIGTGVEWVGAFRDVQERRQERQRREEEEALVTTVQRIGGTLAGELHLDRIVQTVTDAATEVTGAEFGAFFYNLVDARGESYTLYSLSGAPREAFARFPMPRNTQVFEPTFHGTAIVRSDDITADPRYGKMAPHYGMPKGHLPVRSYLAVPVISRAGEVLGGLFFGHSEAGRFNERHERIVSGIAGYAAVAMDNARLYEAERTARREAEAASRAKSDFLAMMSHELRTPLNAIGGYAQLLAMGVRGPVSEAQTTDLDRIARSQRHLLSIINDILNLARIESGQVAYHIEAVDIADSLAALPALVAPLVDAKQLTLTLDVDGVRARASADREKLQQIVLNLLSNAVKFTKPGGSIRIACEADDASVHVLVIDSGEGIPAERQDAIFEPFVQLDTSLTRTREGTGLGLAISRDLALGMDGSLTVESAVGAGSTFRLTLPRASS